jgi:putative colanic acid biosynthesis acetyltransferase WcaF
LKNPADFDGGMQPPVTFQDLGRFRMPPGFRGRGALAVQLWWAVQATLFRWSPQFAYGFRAALLRRFGAKVGQGCVIRPTVTVTYPWKVSIGDRAWIGDDVAVYSLGEITIGHDAVVSQRSYLCAADHDHTQADFPIRARPVHVEPEAWVGTDSFIGPGVTVGRGSVVGARSSVFKSLPPGMMCMGSPCRPVKPRIMRR